MTANIAQYVIPRQRSDFRSSLKWTTRSLSTTRRRSKASWHMPSMPRFMHSQKGSIKHSTITMSLGIVALVAVALLGFFYLNQVISTASQGSDIHTLESDIVQLREQQRQLELEGAQLRSLKAIEDNVQELNLVVTDKVSYLNTEAGKVALKAQ